MISTLGGFFFPEPVPDRVQFVINKSAVKRESVNFMCMVLMLTTQGIGHILSLASPFLIWVSIHLKDKVTPLLDIIKAKVGRGIFFAV